MDFLKTIETTLFENAYARFRIKVFSQFTQESYQNKEYNTWYYSAKTDRLVANSRSYLVFEYFDRDNYRNTKSIWLSHYHIPALKDVLYQIKRDMLNDNFWILTNDGVLMVDSSYQSKTIQKSNGQWINFTLDVLKDDTLGKYVKAVKISYSEVDNSCSVLTMPEFMTVWQIIDDLNLIDIQLKHFILKTTLDNSIAREIYQLKANEINTQLLLPNPVNFNTNPYNYNQQPASVNFGNHQTQYNYQQQPQQMGNTAHYSYPSNYANPNPQQYNQPRYTNQRQSVSQNTYQYNDNTTNTQQPQQSYSRPSYNNQTQLRYNQNVSTNNNIQQPTQNSTPQYRQSQQQLDPREPDVYPRQNGNQNLGSQMLNISSNIDVDEHIDDFMNEFVEEE